MTKAMTESQLVEALREQMRAVKDLRASAERADADCERATERQHAAWKSYRSAASKAAVLERRLSTVLGGDPDPVDGE